MRQITSQLRAAATRRRLIDADVASAAYRPTRFAATALRRSACWAEEKMIRVALAAPFANQSAPRTPQMAPSPRMSSDFTSQVMARLSTQPPEPDPREKRAKQARAHMRRLARVYLALVVIGVAVLIATAVLDPSALLGVVAATISLTVLMMTLADTISRLSGGLISGVGVLYLAMLAALAPPFAIIARRTGRGRIPTSRRS